MIIDFHTHIFPDKLAAKTIPALAKRAGIPAHTDGTVGGLLDSMDQAGVYMSVVLPVATKADQFDSINQFAQYVNDTHCPRLLSFGGIHPDSEDYKAQLDQIKEMGFVGIKLHPDYQGVMIDDVRYMNIIEYADALDLIISVHAGTDIGMPEPVHCPPEKMRKVLDKIKPRKMVLAHCGDWKQWEEVYDCLAGEDVYLDTAFTFDYIKPEMFLKLLSGHDKKKILFATDSPWGHAVREIQALRELKLESGVLEDILANNAKRLLAGDARV